MKNGTFLFCKMYCQIKSFTYISSSIRCYSFFLSAILKKRCIAFYITLSLSLVCFGSGWPSPGIENRMRDNRAARLPSGFVRTAMLAKCSREMNGGEGWRTPNKPRRQCDYILVWWWDALSDANVCGVCSAKFRCVGHAKAIISGRIMHSCCW